MADTREALEELLESLGESAAFAAAGSLTPVLPGLEVEGIGPIGCPVTPTDAKRLIAAAAPAPYGRGEETIVDPKVRRVWQIEPDRLTLRNAAWNDHVAAIVESVRTEFGLRQKVRAELYKLLVYEKGSFFAPHRDTEKTPGMFATLVVCLPSHHEGGMLVIKHDGETKKFDFGGKDAEFKTQYAAFYADCQHEIKPVTAGYRICLVYNLAAVGKKQPAAPQNGVFVEQAAELLKELFADPASSPEKIAIPFKHQYTEAGLDPQQLKGADRARADVLVRAAQLLDYPCHLALLTHWQSGDVDDETWGYDDYRSRRYDRWSYDDDEAEEDDEDGDDEDSSGTEMGEVYDETFSLDHWLDPSGRKAAFGKIHLEEDEILSGAERKGWALEQQVHEATGNEGVSLERWYRQGVIVLWPPEQTFSILAGEGPAAAIPELERMAARAKQPAALEACRRFAAEVIVHWGSGYQRLDHWQTAKPDEPSSTARMLTLLERIGTTELVHRFLRDVLPKSFGGTEGKGLQQVFQRFGWEPFTTAMCSLLAQQAQDEDRRHPQLTAVVALCQPLGCDPPALTEERRGFCLALAEPLVKIIETYDARPLNRWNEQTEEDEDEDGANRYRYFGTEPRAGVVANAVQFFAAIEAAVPLDWFVQHVLRNPRRYPLRSVLIPDCKAIVQWNASVAATPPVAQLIDHCRAELQAATAEPTEPPKDWARAADLGCKCPDCQALARFLRDPAERVGRFPLRKDRRQHLHQQIDRHRCDCTHETERRGSPQTLVCTKTNASYDRRRKRYEMDKKRLAELEAMVVRKRAAPVKRAAAIKRAAPVKRASPKRRSKA